MQHSTPSRHHPSRRGTNSPYLGQLCSWYHLEWMETTTSKVLQHYKQPLLHHNLGSRPTESSTKIGKTAMGPPQQSTPQTPAQQSKRPYHRHQNKAAIRPRSGTIVVSCSNPTQLPPPNNARTTTQQKTTMAPLYKSSASMPMPGKRSYHASAKNTTHTLPESTQPSSTLTQQTTTPVETAWAPRGPGRSIPGVINSRAVAVYKVLSTIG